MVRLVKLLVLSVALCLVTGLGLAQEKKSDKKSETTVSGAICCNKCELGNGSKCATVVKVKEDGKDVVYFFDSASDKKYHSKYCKGTTDGKVTGKVEEKDGKKVITVTKIEAK